MKYIGVIDCNNFFVSCERLFRPDLVGKPVIVLSSNDGCVVARSKEIKDMGIPMGVPAFQLKDMIKNVDVEVFSSHLSLYRDISRRVFSVVKDILPIVEQYSIDEAFFSIESDSLSSLQERCVLMSSQVERAVGIPVSIGVSLTKTQAKYANRLAKKAGKPVILDESWWQENVGTVQLRDIWGVGGQLLSSYREASINTTLDLYQCPKPRLDKLFGIAGLRLQAELSGQMMYPVSVVKTPQKSVTSTRSFKDTTNDMSVLKDAVAHHIRETTLELREQHLTTSKLQVLLQTSRYGDYALRGGVIEVDLLVPTDDTAVLMIEAMRLVERFFEPKVPYKKAGVVLGQLLPTEQVQQSLFPQIISDNNKLNTTIDEINNRFGRGRIQLGKHSLVSAWQSKHDNLSPCYTTRWTDVAVVHAC
ncbi:hypothetical protein A2592_02275 [Candidatus Kaiserbacteria bacterium RIFOXYD1_FULL_42_15]|uniref:UmuC domain-containing protein n=1 Tax=Candidatus Kaiserbacteria bacterium RIFOXYD1_FULL_42_15 TaxID=1798532 RepID=A0A1F6FT98_9BACT|nr:MAG: hypothetical protein A2592_02275 [Candidatus Kaiserbacteria bacterium RIFOXYD1_FULL_42_15]